MAELVPELPDFLQEAGNGCHGTRKKNSTLQTLFHIHERAQNNLRVKSDADWTGIRRQLEVTRPDLRGSIDDFASFVQA